MRQSLILRLARIRRPVATSAPARLFRRLRAIAVGATAAAGLVAASPEGGAAHEIPRSVAVIAYLKPEGNTYRIVARVPLEAMRDIQWPLRGPGYLELAHLDTLLRDGVKIWIADNIRLYEGARLVEPATIANARVSLQSDRSFETYATAVAHFREKPLPPETDLAWQQAIVDLELVYQVESASSRFSIAPTLARLGVRTTTVLHFLPASGGEHTFTYLGDPGLVHLEPRWFQAAGQFISLGFEHILGGLDHLLFIICLVIPFRRLRPLIVIATSFTAAHSVTMVASALGYAPTALWFPPLVEVLIAASIVYTALENIIGARMERRWMIAFGFGLVHGFGFSFALRESLQFAGNHLAVSLAMFNVGVEIGQVFVLLLAVPALNWLFRRIPERAGTIVASALVAHVAWHWMADRWGEFRSFRIEPPALDAAFAVMVFRAALLVAVLAAAVWAGRPMIARVLTGGARGRAAPG
ncbi:MAG: HupE/UreJ family protein [Gemmatimonadaceae bacterium]|nr:HupE/UreJ family protein [Gemmatimonadaceae bacterium]